jgi:hypothetical protein
MIPHAAGKRCQGELSEYCQKHLIPNVQLTTWDDYAIMSMVESGLGSVSCLN